MNTRNVLLIGIGVLALGVAYLAFFNRQPPMLPQDRDHAVFESTPACMICHGPEGESPQELNHPLGNDCLRCHGRGN